ncbi:MAG: right-handed parallel beta-helix repeat-containing protein [Bacteroidetes bacterium]|nr:right-handed parallel beta-helix repeat-containing protein [Bacteroidota bacterium]
MYSINVNGISGTSFKNVTIAKKDSIFVFVKVNINPLNQNNPFLVTDSIVFLTGSQQQNVKLLAYGQDARYIVADQGPEGLRYKVVAGEHETVTWTKDRPYVVYGWATIDSTGTLIIEPGTRIYFHNNSGLWAYRYSNLEVNGTLTEPVLFRGDRLEHWFDEDYNQWNRIWINEGANVNINYAIITNAFIGVQVDPLPDEDGITVTSNSLVKIENTIIKNTKNSGVLSRFLNLEMTNCLVINNGGCGLQLECGQYKMKHLTVANYFCQSERKVPACYVSNKISDPAYKDIPPYDIDAKFQNCIIYGSYPKDNKIKSEAVVYKDKGADVKAVFQNCLVRSEEASPYFEDCVRNEDPMFTDKDKNDRDKRDFTLQSSSPAIGKGKDIGVFLDILGNPRNNPPDIGAYQFVR